MGSLWDHLKQMSKNGSRHGKLNKLSQTNKTVMVLYFYHKIMEVRSSKYNIDMTCYINITSSMLPIIFQP